MRGTNGKAKDARFIQQRVEHSPITESFCKPSRDVIDAAFARHIFTTEERGRVFGESLLQHSVDLHSQMARTQAEFWQFLSCMQAFLARGRRGHTPGLCSDRDNIERS